MFGRYPFGGGTFGRSNGSLVIVVFNAAKRTAARSMTAITGLVGTLVKWGASSRTAPTSARATVTRYGASNGTARGSLS